MKASPATPSVIVTTAKNRAIDRIRQDRTLVRKTELLQRPAELPDEEDELTAIPDERLALVFTCCHPALAPDAQIALTLREVGGLATPEIAHAFLTAEPTMAQRLVRAKRKIREAGIPFRIPPDEELTDRLEAVLAVLYLVFNEGTATAGDHLVRRELCDEAIRSKAPRRADARRGRGSRSLGADALSRLTETGPDERGRRADPARGSDRSLWNVLRIDEGRRVLERAAWLRRVGPYQLQAAIASVHAEETTDWSAIAELYARLTVLTPSPIVELNRAVAVAMARGADEGLDLIAQIQGLDDYHLLHAARADLLRRLGRRDEAAGAYRRALSLAPNPVERASSVASQRWRRRAWVNVARRRGAMVVPRQGRRERRWPELSAGLRTPPRGEQRGPAAQTTFVQALLEQARQRARANRPVRCRLLEPQPGSRMTTRRLSLRANPISESVPQLPPTAITTSPEAATARFRAWPMPVTTAWSIHSLASSCRSPGRIPIVVPPAALAPRAAPAITSPPPPVTTVQLAREQPPDLLGALLVLRATPDYGHLYAHSAMLEGHQ